MSKKAKNIAIVLLLIFFWGIIKALPEQISSCTSSSNATCGDSYGPGGKYNGKKCWPESNASCLASS